MLSQTYAKTASSASLSSSPIYIFPRNQTSFFLYFSHTPYLLRNQNLPSILSHKQHMAISLFSFLLLTLSTFTATPQAASNIESFIFGGCSQMKFTPGSAYESNVNSLLTNLGSSAMFNNYNNFTVPGAAQQDTVYGLFQCRGDLNSGDCSQCVTSAVSKLGTLCPDSCGGALQLDSCFVKYDNTSFLGVEDKTVVVDKCGPSIGLTSDALTQIDAVLAYLGTSDGIYNTYRVSSFGNVQGVAQCVGDLSPSECQDCLSDAIKRLRTECGAGAWGKMYLGKCYVRYSEGGSYSSYSPPVDGYVDNDNRNNNDSDEVGKTLALIIGVIAGVALIIILATWLNKKYKSHKEGCSCK